MSSSLILFEDEHLLVVNKPAGWNTHAPAPFAGEGVYDWLKHREPRWADLAIIHRLDKETSGVMVFSKTAQASRSLTEQFATRAVQKKYLLRADRAVPQKELIVKTSLVRVGEKYVSRPLHAGSEIAETHFRVLGTDTAGQTLLEAEPVTGKTHQIRVHAADNGFPIIGDTLYGGVRSQRICLHAEWLKFLHPTTSQECAFHCPIDFNQNSRDILREASIDMKQTNAYRLAHGSSDGPALRGCYVDRLGNFLLSSTESSDEGLDGALEWWTKKFGLAGAYHKAFNRQVRRATLNEASPRLLFGKPAPERFTIRENGMKFELSLHEGYSTGLFLDQRDNRRRFLVNHVAAHFPLFLSGARGAEVLNTFAYTCGFSVCAAQAGARVTSLDLSKKYLEWGKRNFTLNELDPAAHDFIYGDAFDWLHRLAKKPRAFDAVILDPPTFSQSKEHGTFQADKDYGRLVTAALKVLKKGGVLFACTNAATIKPEVFTDVVAGAIRSSNRKITQQHYAPQPPDFPITRTEPAHLKTLWLRIE